MFTRSGIQRSDQQSFTEHTRKSPAIELRHTEGSSNIGLIKEQKPFLGGGDNEFLVRRAL